MAIRIIIADDHGILRGGLKSLLSADPNMQVVGEANNGSEALRLASELKPNVALMDIGMPGNEGLDATRQLVQDFPATRVIILTMHEDGALLQESLRAGASGYIIKRAVEAELIDAIYAVNRGIIYIHPSLMPLLVARPFKSSVPKVPDSDALTEREKEILTLIVQGYTNREMGDSLNISVRTVETHRSNIMEKLNLHSRVDLVRYAKQHKLIKGD
ncbi:MAG TPA: response regulator transcription factor [Bellilinea sp.]|nr:response regulator transcription factor [Bellilinea sp.]